jgi:NAD(P)H-hydrate epimerase
MMSPNTPIPALTHEQIVEVDRAMVEEYGILPIQMMENAGRHFAHLARARLLDGDPRGKRVVVLAGSGGNGGDALVAARRLHTWGAHVAVALTKAISAFSALPAQQLAILLQLGVHVAGADQVARLGPADAVLDGVIGFSLSGPPRGAAAELIRWANGQEAPVLAMDTPSGLDAGTGNIHTPTVVATATLTLALPKVGLLTREAAPYVGELYLADIGVPPQLYAGRGLDLEVGPLFARDEILRLS